LSHDTWIHRAARGLVRPLAATPVSPNHLTSARLLTGLGAAAGFATGEAGWIQAGAGFFLLSMLLDRADGELARLSGKTSRFGHFYDLYSDAVCDAAVLAGIGVGLRGGSLGAWAIPMGVVAGLSVACIFHMMLRMDRELGTGSSAFSAVGGFDPDDAMLLIPIALVLGFGEELLIAAAVCAPLAAAIVYVKFRARRRILNRSGGGSAGSTPS
jgi:phosphatidylglycerophosphate synthase